MEEEKKVVEEVVDANPKKKKEKKPKKEKKENKVLTWVENIAEVIIIIICIVFSIMTITNPGGVVEDPEGEFHKTNISMMPVLSESMQPTFNKGDLIFGEKLKKEDNDVYETYDIGTVAIFLVVNTQDNMYYVNTHRIVAYVVSFKDGEETINRSFNNETFWNSETKESKVKTFSEAKAAADAAGYTDFTINGYKTRGDNISMYLKDDGTPYDNNPNMVDNYTVTNDHLLGKWNGKKVAGVGGVISWVKEPLHFFLVIMIPLILLFGYNIYIVIKYIIEVKTEKARKLALEEASQNQKAISEEEAEEIRRKAIEEYLRQQKEKEEKDKKE